MSLPALLRIGAFPPIAHTLLSQHFTLVPPEAASDAQWAAFQGLVTRSNQRVDPALIDRLPALRVIATCGVGYDGIAVDHARTRGIEVTHTPGVLDTAVAELAVGLLLALLRRLPAADAFVRSDRWHKEGAFPLGASLAGKRVGIVGLGRIGRAIADRLAPFQVSLAYHGPTDYGLAMSYYPNLATMARDSDILIVCCPGGARTASIIDADVLAALGPRGALVNVSRGSVVDESALVQALQAGTLGAAALDVFETEPTANAALLALEQVVLAPHIGSATEETRLAMAELATANLQAVLAGKPALTPVP